MKWPLSRPQACQIFLPIRLVARCNGIKSVWENLNFTWSGSCDSLLPLWPYFFGPLAWKSHEQGLHVKFKLVCGFQAIAAWTTWRKSFADYSGAWSVSYTWINRSMISPRVPSIFYLESCLCMSCKASTRITQPLLTQSSPLILSRPLFTF